MPLVSSLKMLNEARANGRAVGAFNVENMEMLQAVIAAAEETGLPAIVQTTPGTLKYAPPEAFAALARALCEATSAQIALHLDHGDSLDLVGRALDAGYTSIMIDGSKLPLDENIALTRAAFALCESRGLPLEGELGRVGGKEDTLESETGYTDPDEATRFANETGVSSLAIGVGTAHGVYKTAPILNVELISQLRARIAVPLVLHGASGLSEITVRDCVRRGIAKVNFATELRAAYTSATREYLTANPAAYDPKRFGAAGRDEVARLVAAKQRLLA